MGRGGAAATSGIRCEVSSLDEPDTTLAGRAKPRSLALTHCVVTRTALDLSALPVPEHRIGDSLGPMTETAAGHSAPWLRQCRGLESRSVTTVTGLGDR